MDKKHAWLYEDKVLYRVQSELAGSIRRVKECVSPHTGDFVISKYLENAFAEIQRARLECRRRAREEKAK